MVQRFIIRNWHPLHFGVALATFTVGIYGVWDADKADAQSACVNVSGDNLGTINGNCPQVSGDNSYVDENSAAMISERGSANTTNDAAGGTNSIDAKGSETVIGTLNNNGTKNPIITGNQGSVDINY